MALPYNYEIRVSQLGILSPEKSYQLKWQRQAIGTDTWKTIENKTGSSYEVSLEDRAHNIRLEQEFSNGQILYSNHLEVTSDEPQIDDDSINILPTLCPEPFYSFTTGHLTASGRVIFGPYLSDYVIDVDAAGTDKVTVLNTNVSYGNHTYYGGGVIRPSDRKSLFFSGEYLSIWDEDKEEFDHTMAAERRLDNLFTGILSDGYIYQVSNGSSSLDVFRIKPDNLGGNLEEFIYMSEEYDWLYTHWQSTVSGNNGKFYMIPHFSYSLTEPMLIGEVDIVNKTFSQFGNNIKEDARPYENIDADKTYYDSGVLAPDGWIYCIPRYASKIMGFNPHTKQIIYVGMPPVSSHRFGRGILGPNGKIYAPPGGKGGQFLEFDPVKKTYKMFGAMKDNTSLTSGVLHPNGKMYFGPGNIRKIVTLDFNNPAEGPKGAEYWDMPGHPNNVLDPYEAEFVNNEN